MTLINLCTENQTFSDVRESFTTCTDAKICEQHVVSISGYLIHCSAAKYLLFYRFFILMTL